MQNLTCGPIAPEIIIFRYRILFLFIEKNLIHRFTVHIFISWILYEFIKFVQKPKGKEAKEAMTKTNTWFDELEETNKVCLEETKQEEPKSAIKDRPRAQSSAFNIRWNKKLPPHQLLHFFRSPLPMTDGITYEQLSKYDDALTQ